MYGMQRIVLFLALCFPELQTAQAAILPESDFPRDVSAQDMRATEIAARPDAALALPENVCRIARSEEEDFRPPGSIPLSLGIAVDQSSMLPLPVFSPFMIYIDIPEPRSFLARFLLNLLFFFGLPQFLVSLVVVPVVVSLGTLVERLAAGIAWLQNGSIKKPPEPTC